MAGFSVEPVSIAHRAVSPGQVGEGTAESPVLPRRALTVGPPVLSPEEFLACEALPRDLEVELAGERVSLSSLDRLYWPAERITKGDLLRYYLRVAPAILPLLAGRPAVLKRYPQGTSGAFFYQHNVESGPAWLRRERLPHDGKLIPYAVYSTPASLLHLVNLGNIEQHPWQSRADHHNHPDFLVLDLDPYLAAWFAVVEVALAAREALAAFGLTSWVKTSGGKGLHLYVPLAPGQSHARTKEVAEAVGRFVAWRLPQIATAERRPEARRRGQVYLDWCQNGHGKPLASAYSVRARSGATVSCPLTWDELLAGATLGQFTLRTVPERLARGIDPWAGILERGQGLP